MAEHRSAGRFLATCEEIAGGHRARLEIDNREKENSLGPRALRLQKALLREWEERLLGEAIRPGIDVLAAAYDSGEPKQMASARLSLLQERR